MPSLGASSRTDHTYVRYICMTGTHVSITHSRVGSSAGFDMLCRDSGSSAGRYALPSGGTSYRQADMPFRFPKRHTGTLAPDHQQAAINTQPCAVSGRTRNHRAGHTFQSLESISEDHRRGRPVIHSDHRKSYQPTPSSQLPDHRHSQRLHLHSGDYCGGQPSGHSPPWRKLLCTPRGLWAYGPRHTRTPFAGHPLGALEVPGRDVCKPLCKPIPDDWA